MEQHLNYDTTHIGGGNRNPLQGSFPGELHGQRSLAGYSPWGHKESDMTERLTHTHTTHKDSSSTHKHLSTRYLRNISIMSICLRLLFLLCFLSSLSSFVLVLLCAIWYFPNTSSAIQFQKN